MRSLVGGLLNRSPVPFTSGSRGSGLALLTNPGQGNTEKQMRAYGAVGTLFAIVNRTSTSAAAVTWRLYRKAASGNDEDRVEVASHVALDLVRQPNPFMTGEEFVEVGQQHMDLTGEEWWVVGRNNRLSSMPLELWPVRPDRMRPVPHRTDYLAGYVYTGPDGEEVPLGVGDVIFQRMPNPLDPYRGLGPVQSTLTDLDSERYSAEWNKRFFENGAEPGGIIEVPDTLSDGEFDEMRARWNAQHRGVANAHRVAILERGKWVDRKFSMRDMQFVELRRASRETIREAFGFPKHLLGASDDVNRANADAAEVMFSRWVLTPRLNRRRAALNRDLLGMFGLSETLEFDYDDPTPQDSAQVNADRDSRVAAAVALIGQGFDPAEVLAAFDLPELTYTKPEAPALPAGTGDMDMLTPAAAAALVEAVRAGRRQVVTATARPGHRHRHALPRAQADADPLDPEHDDQLDEVQADWEAALALLLAAWRPVTADWTDQLVDAIEAAVDAADTAALSRLGVDSDDAADLLAEHMADMAALAAERMAADAAAQGVTTDVGEADTEALAGYGAAVAGLLGAGLAAAAGREALRLVAPDSTGAQVARSVADFIGGLSDSPLRDQLGGALSNAQNTGRLATLRLAPEAAYYANERLDSNTCRFCAEVDGRWLGNTLDEVERMYPNGGYTECAGRERCRGTVTAVWRPEQVGVDE